MSARLASGCQGLRLFSFSVTFVLFFGGGGGEAVLTGKFFMLVSNWLQVTKTQSCSHKKGECGL